MPAKPRQSGGARSEDYTVLLTTQEVSVLAVATGLIKQTNSAEFATAADVQSYRADLGRAELADEVRNRLQEALAEDGALNAVRFSGEQWLFAITSLAVFAEFLGQYADSLREGAQADEALEGYFPGLDGDPFRVELIADRARLVQLRLEQKQTRT